MEGHYFTGGCFCAKVRLAIDAESLASAIASIPAALLDAGRQTSPGRLASNRPCFQSSTPVRESARTADAPIGCAERFQLP